MILITKQGPVAVPFSYLLGPKEAFQLESVSAVFNGAAAAGSFKACLSFYAQSGELIGRMFPEDIAAGDTAEVTYAPFWSRR